MTDREMIENAINGLDEIIEFLNSRIVEFQKKRLVLFGQLNRARRLEREELQNAKH